MTPAIGLRQFVHLGRHHVALDAQLLPASSRCAGPRRAPGAGCRPAPARRELAWPRPGGSEIFRRQRVEFARASSGRRARSRNPAGRPGETPAGCRRPPDRKLARRVLPGAALVRASFCRTSALIRVDLPTFERPTIATSGRPLGREPGGAGGARHELRDGLQQRSGLGLRLELGVTAEPQASSPQSDQCVVASAASSNSASGVGVSGVSGPSSAIFSTSSMWLTM